MRQLILESAGPGSQRRIWNRLTEHEGRPPKVSREAQSRASAIRRAAAISLQLRGL